MNMRRYIGKSGIWNITGFLDIIYLIKKNFRYFQIDEIQQFSSILGHFCGIFFGPKRAPLVQMTISGENLMFGQPPISGRRGGSVG